MIGVMPENKHQQHKRLYPEIGNPSLSSALANR